MNKKNEKLLLPFMGDELHADINSQRKHLEDMIKFKERFINHIESKQMLYIKTIVPLADNEEGESTEMEIDDINDNVLNAILEVKNGVDSSFKILMESYAKLSSSSSAIEKAFKENNAEPKEKKKSAIPTGKGTVFET